MANQSIEASIYTSPYDIWPKRRQDKRPIVSELTFRMTHMEMAFADVQKELETQAVLLNGDGKQIAKYLPRVRYMVEHETPDQLFLDENELKRTFKLKRRRSGTEYPARNFAPGSALELYEKAGSTIIGCTRDYAGQAFYLLAHTRAKANSEPIRLGYFKILPETDSGISKTSSQIGREAKLRLDALLSARKNGLDLQTVFDRYLLDR